MQTATVDRCVRCDRRYVRAHDAWLHLDHRCWTLYCKGELHPSIRELAAPRLAPKADEVTAVRFNMC